MPSFSERHGYKQVRNLIQRDELDDETRTELWNVLGTIQEIFEQIQARTSYAPDTTKDNVLLAIWTWEFKKARDEKPSDRRLWALVKTLVLTGEWWAVLDLIEAFVGYLDRYQTSETDELVGVITDAFNNRFEHFLVAYRFIGLEITPVDSSGEAEAIAEALENTASIPGARHSLERAVDLLADRQSPDYPNSIKESISAVEAVVKKVTGEGQLGAGLKKLEAAGLAIHPALKEAWSKMYGWTSDADGIRHAGIEAADADQAIAKYMLVTSSAFVSYLIEAGRKTGMLT